MSGVADGAPADLQKDIETAAAKLRAAKKVVVLTGAGVSKESGIPTFRDALTGLWANYEPEKLATPQGFLSDPPLVWQWYDFRRKKVLEVQPNPGHHAIAVLESLIPEVVVVTQNVDGLHKRAGSTDIVELHGNILDFFCFEQRHPAPAEIAFDLKEPPLCTECGSMMRPGVVWFNEMLPPGAMERASRLVRSADVVLVIGTSGIVYPAASLPYTAKDAGAFVVEVNPDETPITEVADLFLAGPSGELLPMLVERLRAYK